MEHDAQLNAAYMELQNKAGFENGDKVKILRKARNYELGWKCDWAEEMNSAVGEIGTVMYCNTNGVRINCEHVGYTYMYPFFVLELIEKAVPTPITDDKFETTYNAIKREVDERLKEIECAMQALKRAKDGKCKEAFHHAKKLLLFVFFKKGFLSTGQCIYCTNNIFSDTAKICGKCEYGEIHGICTDPNGGSNYKNLLDVMNNLEEALNKY